MQKTYRITPTLSVTLGAKPMDLKVHGIFVRNGLNEIKAYVDTKAKELIDAYILEKQSNLDQAVHSFNTNAFSKTQEFNTHLEEQKNYVAEQAIQYATAPIEENPDGSAKYWAEQAKINYQEALDSLDDINNEEV